MSQEFYCFVRVNGRAYIATGTSPDDAQKQLLGLLVNKLSINEMAHALSLEWTTMPGEKGE